MGGLLSSGGQGTDELLVWLLEEDGVVGLPGVSWEGGGGELIANSSAGRAAAEWIVAYGHVDSLHPVVVVVVVLSCVELPWGTLAVMATAQLGEVCL